jgi:hypothetical protein
VQHIKKIKKNLAISFCYCSKYISSIKKKREKQKTNRSKRRLLDSAAEN